jgi:predicted Zn-dependent protease
MQKRILRLCGPAPVLACIGCLLLPGELGLQSLEEDRRLGAGVAQQVADQIGVFGDPEKGAYLTAIGDRLVSHLDDKRFSYSFRILDQDEPNAFAAPGGSIYVSRGLLALTISEDELAGVVGHEMIHVSRRHTARQLGKERAPLVRLLTLPGRVVGRVVNRDLGRLVNAPIGAVGKVVFARYSRGQESEADKLGVALSASTGYDPAALAAILGRLQREVERRTGTKQKSSFFDSHPTTPTRVEDIKALAHELVWTTGDAIAPDRAAFLGRLDGLPLGADPARGVFQGRKFLHPDAGFTITFPEGWETVNTPKVVGAMAPQKDALMFVGIHSAGTDAKQAADEFVRELEREFGVRPSRSETVQAGHLSGYVVTIEDVSTSPPMHLHLLWVPLNGVLYEFIGLAPDRLRPTLRSAALTFRTLTDQERASIVATRIRVITAREGETLADVTERTGNVWDTAITALYNGMAENQRLAAGEPIKIAVREPYRSPGAPAPAQ